MSIPAGPSRIALTCGALLCITLLSTAQEFRGAWLTPRSGSTFWSQSEIARAMDSLKRNHFNTVMFNVWSQGYPLFRSGTFHAATGGWGYTDPKAGERDLLAEAVAEAHRVGLEIEAWFEYGFVGGYSGNKPATSRRSILIDTHPDWLGRSSGGIDSVAIGPYAHYWMSNEHADVRRFLIGLAVEVAERYDVDAIELDRVRYPTDRQTDWGYDSATVATYVAEFGVQPPAVPTDAAWMRWRADKLNAFHRAAYDSIKSRSSSILVTNAPAHYSSSSYYAAYVTYLQDWAAWVNEGSVDAVHLQQYVSDASILPSYLSSWMTHRVTDPAKQRRVFPGIAVSPNSNPLAAASVLSMIQATRNAGLEGNAVWYYNDLNLVNGDRTYFAHLRSGPYAEPAHNPLRPFADWRWPATIVTDYDTSSSGPGRVVRTGTWTRSNTVFGYSDRLYVSTSTGVQTSTTSARVPHDGWYDVYGFVVGGGFRSTRAPYDLIDTSGTRRILVDQSNIAQSGWKLLGTSYLRADSVRPVVVQSNDGIEAGTGVNTGGVMLVLNRKRSPEARLTSIAGPHASVPATFTVSAPFPNPFNPSTTVRYSLASSSRVRVTVHDLLGRIVDVLVDETREAGEWSARWSADRHPSGMYLIRVTAGGRSTVVKAILVK